ncbi:hypothetical protein BU14_0076s0055 [Porphyra umbilicalis]|uniref:Uncharacterized protein n=1 Tax=Porphyra umbilicalis TaxID=2786 RepID=A0A1X6PF83_PORUM|nr:hypothetical protein BU14_0076s0055 [Porphyra umbilicalis]|eukprot:OSX79499.1 hypothetical protein BU14_0076s0055 [Porphyra umbilicalis]
MAVGAGASPWPTESASTAVTPGRSPIHATVLADMVESFVYPPGPPGARLSPRRPLPPRRPRGVRGGGGVGPRRHPRVWAPAIYGARHTPRRARRPRGHQAGQCVAVGRPADGDARGFWGVGGGAAPGGGVGGRPRRGRRARRRRWG